MKSALLLVLIVAGCFAAAAGILQALRIHLNPSFPVIGGAVAVLSGLGGLLPVIRNSKSDAATLLQRALAGTILHLLVSAVLSLAVVAMTPHDQRLGLVYWVLGGYWISLLIVVWQSRHIIVKASENITGLTPDGTKAH